MSETNPLEEATLQDLYLRAGILKTVIAEAKRDNDPRVINPESQLVIIEAEIARRGENVHPRDVVIGLQSLRMSAKRG